MNVYVIVIVNVILRDHVTWVEDWVYSSAEMVRHCFANDFEDFLDVSRIVPAGASVSFAGSARWSECATGVLVIGVPIFFRGKTWGHATYGKMLNRRVVFPHHDPGGKERQHFVRCAERLLHVLAQPGRKLFVIVHIVRSRGSLQSGTVQGNSEQVGQLYEQLCQRGVRDFELLAVHLVEGPSNFDRHGTLHRVSWIFSVSQHLFLSRGGVALVCRWRVGGVLVGLWDGGVLFVL